MSPLPRQNPDIQDVGSPVPDHVQQVHLLTVVANNLSADPAHRPVNIPVAIMHNHHIEFPMVPGYEQLPIIYSGIK